MSKDATLIINNLDDGLSGVVGRLKKKFMFAVVSYSNSCISIVEIGKCYDCDIGDVMSAFLGVGDDCFYDAILICEDGQRLAFNRDDVLKKLDHRAEWNI